jgi:hypothetical protein
MCTIEKKDKRHPQISYCTYLVLISSQIMSTVGKALTMNIYFLLYPLEMEKNWKQLKCLTHGDWFITLKSYSGSRAPAAHTCNPSYSGGLWFKTKLSK